MDKKRPRSSLRKAVGTTGDEDNTTVSHITRLKRRISFSGKHSVREFNREKEPKTWNDSYEISDHLNAEDTKQAPALNGSSLINTMDFINASQRTSTLHIENSVDITLLEIESALRGKSENKLESRGGDCSGLSRSSVSERDPLRSSGECTLDFMEDYQKRLSNHRIVFSSPGAGGMKSNERLALVPPTQNFGKENKLVGHHFFEKSYKERQTIYMNDTMAIDCQEAMGRSKRKTTHQPEELELSSRMMPQLMIDDDDKENIFPEDIYCKTSNDLCDMEMGADLFTPNTQVTVTSPEIVDMKMGEVFTKIFFDDPNVNVKMNEDCQTVPMEMSVVGNELDQQNNKPNQLTVNCSERMEETITDTPYKTEMSPLRECDLNQRRSHSKVVLRKIFLPMIQTSTTKGEPLPPQEKDGKNEQKTQSRVVETVSKKTQPSLLQFSIEDVKDVTLSPELTSLLPTEYKTYNFRQLNRDLELGKIRIFPSVSQVPTTSTSSEIQSSSLKKSTSGNSEIQPSSHKKSISGNSEVQSSLHKKSTSGNSEVQSSLHKKSTSGNSEIQSSLHKKSTSGNSEIQSSSLKKSTSGNSEIRKQSETLHFEDMDVAIHLDKDFSDHIKPLPGDGNLNCTVSRPIEGDKSNCRYSQADDILLDNTNFLARARLGDESASRNSSRKDSLQVSVSVDMELDEENKLNASMVRAMYEEAKPIFSQTIAIKKDNHMICDESLEPLETKEEPEGNEDFVNGGQSSLEKISSKNKRLTQHFGEDIEDIEVKRDDVQGASKKTSFYKKDIISERDVSTSPNCVISQKTLRSARPGTLEKMDLDLDNQTVKRDTNIPFDGKPSFRRTLYFNNSIVDEADQLRRKGVTTKETQSEKTGHLRQTIYLNRDIDEDIIDQMQQQRTFHRERRTNENGKSSQTLHFDKSIDVDVFGIKIEENYPNSDNLLEIKNTDPDTKHFEQFDNNIDKIIESDNKEKLLRSEGYEHRTNEEVIKTKESPFRALHTNHVNNHRPPNDDESDGKPPNLQSHGNCRQTLYFNNDIDMAADPKNNGALGHGPVIDKKPRQTLYLNSEIDTSLNLDSCSNVAISSTSPIKGQRRTLYFNEENKNNISPDCGGTLNSAITPKRQAILPFIRRTANASKLRQMRAGAMGTIDVTPLIKTNKRNQENLQKMCEMTPRLSFIEFMDLERESDTSRIVEKKNCVPTKQECGNFESPVQHSAAMKRLPVNLTPNVPLPKKRQTLLFENCNNDMSLSLMSDSPPQSVEVLKCRDKVRSTAEKRSVEVDCSVKIESNESEVIDLTANIPFVINEPTEGCTEKINVEQKLNSPSARNCARKSRIPIPVAAAKGNNRFHLNELEKSDDDDDDENAVDMFESIEMPRKATTRFVESDEIVAAHPKPENDHSTIVPKFEDNPITISDVSVFFLAQRKNRSPDDDDVEDSAVNPSDPDPLCPLETGEEENKVANMSSFRKRFVNLSSDSPLGGDSEIEDIEKTNISLVETLPDDNDDDDDVVKVTEKSPVEQAPIESFPKPSEVKDLRNVTLCRKCKRCQETFLNETTSSIADSFVLPSLPPLPSLGLDHLRSLRNRPTIAKVNELWRRFSLDRTWTDNDIMLNSDLEDSNENKDAAIDGFIEAYAKDLQKSESALVAFKLDPKELVFERESFVHRLKTLLRGSTSNWIFNDQMQNRSILQFSHKQIYTSIVVVVYEENSAMENHVVVKSVKLQSGLVPKKNWKAIDFVLDFQLKLELPFDLKTLCERNDVDGVFNMLQTIDKIFQETANLGKKLERTVFQKQASLIRDENRTFVQKIVRKVVASPDKYSRADKTEFQINLTNIRKLCFKDIALPPVYSFREEIQFLPIGVEFLNLFLHDPLTHLRN